MTDPKIRSSGTFNAVAAVTIILITSAAIPQVYSTEDHPSPYQSFLTLARKFFRLTGGNCGSSNPPQRLLDLPKVWTTLGHALMAGFDCNDRLLCPGTPSCHQLIDLALNPSTAQKRQARHVPSKPGRYGGDLETFPIRDSVNSPLHDDSKTQHHSGHNLPADPNFAHRQSAMDVGSVSQAGYPTQFMYDGAVQGMEGQLTLSHTAPLEQTNLQGQITMADSQNYPTQMRGQFPRPAGGVPSVGYYWLPPHPQTMWWLQQDAMRGRSGTPGTSYSQNRYLKSEAAPGKFRANNYHHQNQFHEDYSDGYRKDGSLQQSLDETDIPAAQQWSRPASRDGPKEVTDPNDDEKPASMRTEIRQHRKRPRIGRRKKKAHKRTNPLQENIFNQRNSTREPDRRNGQQPQRSRRNRFRRLRKTTRTVPTATTTTTKAAESTVITAMESIAAASVKSTATMAVESTSTRAVESTSIRAIKSTATMAVESTSTRAIKSTATMAVESTSTRAIKSTSIRAVKSTATKAMESTVTTAMESTAIPTVETRKSTEVSATTDEGSTTPKTVGSTTAQAVDTGMELEAERQWQRRHGVYLSPPSHNKYGRPGPDNRLHGSQHRNDPQNAPHSEYDKDDDNDDNNDGHREYQSDRHHNNPGPQSPRRPADRPQPHLSSQQHLADSLGQQPPHYRASFFNQSAVFIRVFFTAITYASRQGEACDHNQDYPSSPLTWVDWVCNLVEREAAGGDWGQREVRRLEETVMKAFKRWRHDRFIGTVSAVSDNDQFVEQHKCFDVLVPDERRPHRISVQNCHWELHDFITRLSTAIFTRLLLGYRPVTADQLCETDFVEDVFNTYGTQNKHALSVEGVQRLLDRVALNTNCSQKMGPSQTQGQSIEQQSVGRSSLFPDGHHDVRRKRQTPRDVTISKRSTHSQHSVHRRFSARELVSTVLGNMTHSVNMQQFYSLCPALLQQLMVITSERPQNPRVHKDMGEDDEGQEEEERNVYAGSAMQTYGLGTASVAVITLCSLLGAVVVRMCRGVGHHYAMASLLALAVGNLCGDALLHLLPEALGLEHQPDHGVYDNHDDHNNNAGDDDNRVYHLAGGLLIDDVRLKCLALLASVYLFWLLEIVTCRYYQPAPEASDNPCEEPDTSDSVNTYEMVSPQCVPKPRKHTDVQLGQYQKSSGHLVWMIVMGDAVHNLADGLAIGAAFAHSVPFGLSTSMAVVSHELPHEMGDFAVLMSTGMKVKKALLLNLLSALTAFLGLYVGLGVGEHLPARQWIFVIVAGMFLYVSLADLIPELIRYFRFFGNARMFIVQSLGLLVGFTLMLLLVLVESKLHF